ncbi:zinc finger protein 862-like [Saccoglossus kowalevskii]|uniref:Zinc finger protein 862-like n=1 Tax=Saccoglossus kowalevskii TaxID=10224 RepID=A0ABM0LZ70_SACKO|nr:PREDICTED: zinc finger protein 862-like [Saccoglossus kowalevskii]
MLKFITSSKRKKPSEENEENHDPTKKKTRVDVDEDHTKSPQQRKQSSGFRNEWVRGREAWLYCRYDEGMFCRLCQKFNKRPFDRDTWNVTACKRIRLSSIKDHEQISAHRDAVKREMTSATSQNIGEVIQPEVKKDAITSAFKVMHFLAKRRIPHTTNFEPVLNLLSQLGMSVKADLHVSKSVTYCSERSMHEMIIILSSVLEDKTINELKQSEFYSIMLDETTDVSVGEQLTLNCWYLDSTRHLRVKFLKMVEPLKPDADDIHTVTLNAENITRHVTTYFRENELDYEKLVGVGTDGAAVMTGKRSGVVKRLQEIATTAIGIHCCAHRLQLASSQAANAVPYVKKFVSILRQLYDYFDNSAVRSAGLSAIQTTLREQELKLLQPSSTRWLSVDLSVTRLKNIFASVLMSLDCEGEERSDAKAVGLQNLMSSWRFIATMLLMCDLLPHVSRLSKAFQASEFEYSSMKPLVRSTITTITDMKHNDGENLQQLPDLINKLQQSDITVKTRADDAIFFKNSVRGKYIDTLITNIEQRFPDKDSGILGHFSIFKPDSLRRDSSTTYGNADVRELSHHFLQREEQPDITADAVNEWGNFKNYLKDTILHQPDLTPGAVVDVLCTTSSLQFGFPKIVQLAKIYRVLPCHTADSERTFSQLKLVKTIPRNRLGQDSLDSLIRIAVDGPSVDTYNYSSAVKRWAEMKNRRISLK